MIVTDAWLPQTNGVVTTLTSVMGHLPDMGIEVTVVHPGLFKTWPLPSYPEIRVARNPRAIGKMIKQAAPDTVHIATEGPLGLAARRYCIQRKHAFTTSLHTKFPEYVSLRLGIPLSLGYRLLKWFHAPAKSTLVTTESHQQELQSWGFDNTYVWSRGVDTSRFKPLLRQDRGVRPRLLYVGRVAVEKNIEQFLSLDVIGDKVVVGDGPARSGLQARFPQAQWLGYRHGDALVAEYAAADVFVFPSLTDTFGLVMLEAMACGTPVAAFPVTGPKDIVINGRNGCLNEDLGVAVQGALQVDRTQCRSFALANDWREIAQRLALNLCDRHGNPIELHNKAVITPPPFAA